MTDTNVERNVAFIEQRERVVAKQALAAVTDLHDVIALKRQIRLPVLPETRQAIQELEGEIGSLKLKLLRSPQPDQPPLPGMEDLTVAKEGEPEANAS